jgi:hypothetical protein
MTSNWIFEIYRDREEGSEPEQMAALVNFDEAIALMKRLAAQNQARYFVWESDEGLALAWTDTTVCFSRSQHEKPAAVSRTE